MESCCFCGIELDEFSGNNPWPAAKGDDDRCCGGCNAAIVIPALMREDVAAAACN